MDKKAGTLVVDRFLYTPMRYPGNYGFIPHTLSEDGDPCDILVANTRPIIPGAIIAVRPIGVLKMTDDGSHTSGADLCLRHLRYCRRAVGVMGRVQPSGPGWTAPVAWTERRRQHSRRDRGICLYRDHGIGAACAHRSVGDYYRRAAALRGDPT